MDTGAGWADKGQMVSGNGTGRSSWCRVVGPSVVLLVICSLWIVLSQVSVWPGRRGPVFLGPDGLLAFLEDRTIDARFAMRGDIPPPLKVCYVDVDTNALEALGNFPWNRAIFASVTDALFDLGGIRGIGFDFVFSPAGLPNLGREEAEQGSMALGRSVKRHGAVVLAASYSSGQRLLGRVGGFPFRFDQRRIPGSEELPELPGFPVMGPTWGRAGLIDVVGDGVRYVPVFAEAQGQTYLTMALQLALIHYGLSPAAVEIGDRAVELRGENGERVAGVPLLAGQFVEPNWFSPWYSSQNPRASVVSVLEQARLAAEGTEEEKVKAAKFFHAFRDAIVLVGPTDPLLKDVSPAPLNAGHAVPRVSLHGNLLKTIVGDRFLWRPPVWVNILLITGVGLGVAGLSVFSTRLVRGGKLLAALAAALYAGLVFALFSRADIVLPLVAPLGAALTCTLYAVVARLAVEEGRRRRIKTLFGSYVSASVVEEIVEHEINPQTGGAEIEITAFFSDIVSFSPLSEKLSPTDLVALMCEYLGEGTGAITAAGGTLDKYVGDAIIAMFGAPVAQEGHAAAACRAALALQEGQARLREHWNCNPGAWPGEVLRMRTRVGLNTGRAVVGNVGSSLRFNYTMMGSTVNLAQRMEAAVAHFGTQILVTAATREAALKHDGLLVFRALDRILVAGNSEPVEVFDLLGHGEEAVRANRSRVEAFDAALAFYREARWDEARNAFLAAAEYEPAGKNPCMVMASRCETFAASAQMVASAFPVGKE